MYASAAPLALLKHCPSDSPCRIVGWWIRGRGEDRSQVPAETGGRVDGQRETYLDEADMVLMRPDVTWWSGDHCLAVIDAKYKRTTSDDYPNADAYQMLAYCTRLGLRRGVLVYADLHGEAGDSTIIRNAGIKIVATALDISGSIEDLRSSVTALARLVSASA